MVVVLVLLTFAVFIGVSFYRERRQNAALLVEGDAVTRAVEYGEPQWVAGFRLPSGLLYHPGHTWVHPVSETEAFVGLDDFARRLIGSDASVWAPEVGSRVAQGQRAITVERGSTRVPVLSPVGGQVIGVNPSLRDDPGLPYRESYGRGWLYKIRSNRLSEDLANLLNGSLARRWMEDTRDRLQRQLILAHGTVLQDGGAPAEDLANELNHEEWLVAMDEFMALKNHGTGIR